MKKQKPLRVLLVLTIINLLIGTYTFHKTITVETEEIKVQQEKSIIKNTKEEVEKKEKEEIVVETKEELPQKIVVYDDLTIEELSAKLDRSLYSTLSGYGSVFANLSLQYNMDPYLVVAIVLEETGCKWGCSYLVRNCNNIGGMKGSPSCAGAYRSFETLEIGIQSYIENLYYNYYSIGLTTPEAMNTKYAESKIWASEVNAYIEEIKAK